MGDVNLGIKLNNLDKNVADTNTKVDEFSSLIEELNKIISFKNQCALISQSDYEVIIEGAVSCGNTALITVNIKSLTQESYPSGQNWKPIITLPFNNKGILTETISSRNGDYKPLEISCNNSNQVYVRGGSINSTYTDTILLLK